MPKIGALENLGLSHTNGYLIWGISPRSVLDKTSIDLEYNPMDSLMIPCMIYTQVAGVTKRQGKIYQHVTNKIVHQVYSSAVPINTYRNGGNLNDQIAIARDFLFYQYLGTIALGIILFYHDQTQKRTTFNHPRINLTLIGGGVFGVDKRIIVDYINRAINYLKGYEFDVYIHAFSDEDVFFVEEKIKAEIVEFGTDLSATPELNDLNNYVLIIPGNNKIDVFRLRDYQLDMLSFALTAADGDYAFKKVQISATIFVRTRKDGYKIIGFVGNDRINKYFVNLQTDPNFDQYFEYGGGIDLYKNGQILTRWPY